MLHFRYNGLYYSRSEMLEKGVHCLGLAIQRSSGKCVTHLSLIHHIILKFPYTVLHSLCCCVVLQYNAPHCTILYSSVLCCAMLCHVVPCCIALYCTALHCTVLQCSHVKTDKIIDSNISLGWGKVDHPGYASPKLQQAQLPLVSNKECANKLDNSPSSGQFSISQQMLCAGIINPGNVTGGCHGDSGGPLVCKAAEGRYVLHGAVSWGSETCNFNQENKQYTVFARISELRDWIEMTLYKN